ncbi:condensation domain-containing protein [Actinosynnema sp. NPDC004786]
MRYPLSFAQRRVWERDRLVAGGPSSVRCHAAWLDGPVDPAALRRAVDAVVARHAVLRTVVVTVEGVPEQVVAEAGTVPVEHVALPGEPEAEAFAAALAERPFDLARGPLARVALVEVGPDRWLFALVVHGIAADGAALAILLGELSTAYRAGAEALPEQWMDHGDFVVWQRERLRGEELARQLDHWRDALAGAVGRLALPIAARSARPGRVTAVVDPAATGSLGDLPGVVLAAYAAVLSRYARQDDVLIGVGVSGRVRAELEPVVGPLADAVPVRVSLAGDPSFADLVVRVRDAATHALAHDEVPFDLLADRFGIDVRGHAARFAFPPAAAPALDLPGVAVRGRLDLLPAPAGDLDLAVDDDGAVTLAHFADAAFAEEFLRAVVAVVEHVGRAPGTRLSALPVTAPDPLPVPVDAVPVDESHLSDPGGAWPTEERHGPAPTPEGVEETMARIWAELVRAPEPVGVHDNLFARGGGSLTAVRFAARIADTYGVTLPLDRIFTSPTIAALADVVSAELGSGDDDALAALSDDELEDLLRAVTATRDRRRAAKGDAR